MKHLLSILFVVSTFHANALDLITYGATSSTLSGELILIAEHLTKDPNANIKLLNIEKGLSYRKNSLFILSGDKKAEVLLDKAEKSDKRKTLKFHYFESNRSFLVVSPDAPTEFLNLVKKKKYAASEYHDYTRIWNDLRWGEVDGGRLQDSQYPFYDFKRKEWNVGKQWQFAFFMTYHLSMNGQKFFVTALPKEYGGLWRIHSTVKKHKKKSSIVMSTGGITPLLNDKTAITSNHLDTLSQLGEQFVAAAYSDILGYNKYLQPYMQKWNGNPPINFLSANLYKKDGEKLQRLFKPYVIVNRSGKRVAIIGLSNPKLSNSFEKQTEKYPWLKKLVIKETHSVLKNLYQEIRGNADLVILLANMNPEDYAKELWGLRYIDIGIHRAHRTYGWPERKSFFVSDYVERSPRTPIATIFSQDVIAGLTDVRFPRSGKDISISNRTIPLGYNIKSDGARTSGYRNFANLFVSKDIVLPDHRELYPEKVTVTREEFAVLAAETMRKKLQAEVGLFNIQVQHSDIIGEQDSSIIHAWVRPVEQLNVLYLKGSDINDIIQRSKKTEYPNQIAISGIDKSGHINGIPIQPNETYRVVSSTAVSKNTSSYPSFKRASKSTTKFISQDGAYKEHVGGKTVRLSDFLVDVLRRKWNAKKALTKNERNQFYRDLYEGKTSSRSIGYWVHDLKKISLEYSQLKTTNLTDFQNVQDSRLAATDQELFSGSLAYSAIYRKNPYVAEIGAKGQYSKIRLRPDDNTLIENVLFDDLVYFANIGLPIFSTTRFPSIATQMGPILEVAYDTEFEKDDGQELEKNLQSFLGWKFNSGSFVKSLTVASFIQKRLTNNSEKNDFGANIRFEIAKPFWEGKLTWRSNLDYKYFLDDDDDSNEDLRNRIVWDNSLDLKIIGGLSFGPYFKYFTFSGKTTDGFGTQTVMGVNLSFTGMWKPKYQ